MTLEDNFTQVPFAFSLNARRKNHYKMNELNKDDLPGTVLTQFRIFLRFSEPKLSKNLAMKLEN